MDTRLFSILVCPICKGRLHFDRPHARLVCNGDRLAYPIRDGIPVMLENEATKLEHTVEFEHPENP